MKTYKLTSEITLTEEQVREIVDAYNTPEFEYPLFKRNKNTDAIVKFTGLRDGIVVWKGNGNFDIGETSVGPFKHTDTNRWEDVSFDIEKDLWHKQPVLCWDDTDKCGRSIRFYSAIKDCVFDFDGEPAGTKYDYYKAITSDRYDDWIIEAFNTLED